MTETEKPGRKFKTVGVVLGIVLALSLYPGYWMTQGYMFAQNAAAHGISVSVPPKLDGFAFGARPSQAAIAKELPFDSELYDEMGKGDYLRQRYGVKEGLSGFFFGVGTKLGRST